MHESEQQQKLLRSAHPVDPRMRAQVMHELQRIETVSGKAALDALLYDTVLRYGATGA